MAQGQRHVLDVVPAVPGVVEADGHWADGGEGRAGADFEGGSAGGGVSWGDGKKGGLRGSDGVADGLDFEVGDEEGSGAGVEAGGEGDGGEEGEEGEEGGEFHFGNGGEGNGLGGDVEGGEGPLGSSV